MFEQHLARDIEQARTVRERYAHAEELIIANGLSDLEPYIARSWLYMPSDSETVLTHPDWPERVWKPRHCVHISLYVPFDNKDQVRSICLASGLEWRKTYTIDNASYPRKTDFFEEHWTWNENLGARNPYEHDEITIVLYRPVVEGEEINGCKVVMHQNEPSQPHPYLTLLCRMDDTE